jgi:hypothetical protein
MTTYTNINNSLLQGKTVFKSPAQKLTYLFLTSFSNCEKVFPSISKIAEGTCQSERTAMRVVKELEELGFITVERKTGKPNLYTLVSYEQVVTPDKMTPVTEPAPEPVTECQLTPVTDCHPKTTNLLKTKNKSNISITRESVINELMNEYPQVPVQEIASQIESDSSLDVKTINQFKGLLTYRVKNHKPAAKQSNKKIIRTEIIPEHFDENFVAPAPAATKESVQAKLKALGIAQ